jgi:hypothetical protein
MMHDISLIVPVLVDAHDLVTEVAVDFVPSEAHADRSGIRENADRSGIRKNADRSGIRENRNWHLGCEYRRQTRGN